MQTLRKSALRAPQRLPISPWRVSRQFASEPPKPSSSTGHSAGDGKEHFSTSFYVFLGALPVGLVLINLGQSNKHADEDPFFTQLIKKYSEKQEDLERKSALKARMLDQAAEDSILFNNATVRHHEARWPEMFNIGSPWNVSAGRSWGNIDAAIEKYRAEYEADENAKLRALQDGTLKAIEADSPPSSTPKE